MAQSTAVKKAWRTLIWLVAIFAVLAGVLAGGVLWSTATWTPKLALDLEGGRQIILTPKLEASDQQISSDQLDQAVAIIRQRVDASGVSEAEVTTQGAQNVVVSIPGVPDEDTLNRIEGEGQVVFRYLANPNGSARDIAGIVNTRGNVMGMMPHPERASDPILGRTGGTAVFQSLMEAA